MAKRTAASSRLPGFGLSPGQVAWVEPKPARPRSMEVFEETDRHLMSGVGIQPDLRSLAGRTCVAQKPTLIFRGGRSRQSCTPQAL